MWTSLTRVAYQPDPFARLGSSASAFNEWLAVAAVTESHPVENTPPRSTQCARPRPVGHAQGFHVNLHHVFHVVDATLQIRDVVANVA